MHCNVPPELSITDPPKESFNASHKRKSRLLQSCRLGSQRHGAGTISHASLPASARGRVRLRRPRRTPGEQRSASPIKHVIVIIGENRSFDHVFATYVPKRPGETVDNLLSKGIIKLDTNKNAIPGPNFEKAHQVAATGCRHGRCVPAEPAEADVPQQPVAGAAGRRSEGLLHPQRMRQHADHQLRREPDAGAAVGKRPAIRTTTSTW